MLNAQYPEWAIGTTEHWASEVQGATTPAFRV